MDWLTLLRQDSLKISRIRLEIPGIQGFGPPARPPQGGDIGQAAPYLSNGRQGNET